jgi:hypothetical protein
MTDALGGWRRASASGYAKANAEWLEEMHIHTQVRSYAGAAPAAADRRQVRRGHTSMAPQRRVAMDRPFRHPHRDRASRFVGSSGAVGPV